MDLDSIRKKMWLGMALWAVACVVSGQSEWVVMEEKTSGSNGQGLPLPGVTVQFGCDDNNTQGVEALATDLNGRFPSGASNWPIWNESSSAIGRWEQGRRFLSPDPTLPGRHGWPELQAELHP